MIVAGIFNSGGHDLGDARDLAVVILVRQRHAVVE